MVVGGSSGAQSINRALRQALPGLTTGFQVLHLCGEGNLDTNLEGTAGLLPARVPDNRNAPTLTRRRTY